MKYRNEAKDVVCKTLMQVPFAAGCEMTEETHEGFLVRYALKDGTQQVLEAVVLTQAYPAVTLRAIQSKSEWRGEPLVVSPFISQETVQLCAEHHVSCLDLAGNCRICFGSVIGKRKLFKRELFKLIKQFFVSEITCKK